MLNEILMDSNFFTFYLKNYLKRLDGKKIMYYYDDEDVIYNNLKSLGCKVDKLNKISTQFYDGVVISNIGYTFTTELFQRIHSILTDNGKVLVIMHVKKTNICFDQEEEISELKELNENIDNLFEIEENLISDDSWKFLIIKKNTIK